MMIAVLLLLLAQDAPKPAPAPDPEVEEVVIKATYGRTVMLFDKGADNKLRNCRVMVSSGSQQRDANACQATPVCFAKTADIVTECVELSAMEPMAPVPKPMVATSAGMFELPKLVQPKPVLSASAIGPVGSPETSPESERQRVKLPPLPQSPTGGPVIRITNGNAEDK